MSNDKDFKVKNGIQPTVYQEGLGTVVSGSVAVGYDLENATYDNVSSSISEGGAQYGIAYKSDGTRFYFIDNPTTTGYQYNLTTGWDVSTMSYANKSFNFGNQDGGALAVAISSDGTKMYMIGYSNDRVYQYTLSTPYELNTASYDSVSFQVVSQVTNARGLSFKSDGTKMYIGDTTAEAIFQYSLSTAWDVSTASYDSVSLDVSTQTTSINSSDISQDGKYIVITGSSGSDTQIYQYLLSTAWDLSTASHDSTLTVTSVDNGPLSAWYNNDGSKLFYSGYSADAVYQFTSGSTLITNTLDLSTGSAFQITPTSDIQVGLSNPAASGTVSQATLLLDGAVNGYDLSGAAYDSVSFSVSSQEADPTEIAFNNDGTKMYVMGLDSGCVVYQYSLSTAFDVSTASYDSVSFSVNSQSPYSYGLSFNDDGTKMYVLGNTGSIYQYSLSTAFDLSTASYDSVSFNASSQDVNTYAITFNNNGTKMYVSGAGAPASIYQYSLSTAFNLSTAGYDSVSLNVSSQETSPYGLKFNSDGTKVYVSGFSSDSIHQYSLSTAFDLSTASYDSVSFSVSGQATAHYALTFSADGTKMHILSSTQNVYQYSTGSAYTVTYDNTIQFGGGTAPDSPLANETDVLTFSTRDGGTSYQAMQAIDGAK